MPGALVLPSSLRETDNETRYASLEACRFRASIGPSFFLEKRVHIAWVTCCATIELEMYRAHRV